VLLLVRKVRVSKRERERARERGWQAGRESKEKILYFAGGYLRKILFFW
jgi:hypothetical protein